MKLCGEWALPVTVGVINGRCSSGDVVVAAALALVRNAPKARPGILPMQKHREPLAEHDGTGAFGLELAVSQG